VIKRDNAAYSRWDAMKQRCLNKNNTNYHHYGGRGIKICKKWLEFDGFLEDMGNPCKGMTLDRKDNSKGYNLSNCRWVTQKEQMNNTRSNNVVTYKDKTMNVCQWAEYLDVKANTIIYRLRRNWPIGEALGILKRVNNMDKRRSGRLRDCLLCGGEFTPRAYQLKMGQGKYCSYFCARKRNMVEK